MLLIISILAITLESEPLTVIYSALILVALGLAIPLIIFSIIVGVRAIKIFKHDLAAGILTLVGAIGIPVVGIIGASRIIKYSEEKLREPIIEN